MHFTYEDGAGSDPDSLCQGDVLNRTPDVDAVLKEVHPHYLKPDYLHFIVLTQGCDLVRRRGDPCSSRYISLAAVRSCETVLDAEFERHARDAQELRLRFSDHGVREKLAMFCERLLNNNEPRYFYLHAEPAAGLHVDCCAFLQLSIAVKSSLHYDKLHAARILRLKEAFQHKLGYLVGNMYSRVGTEDWVPNQVAQEDFASMINKRIGDDFALWLPRDVCKRVKVELERLPDERVDEDALEKAIREAQQYPKRVVETAVKAIEDEARQMGMEAAKAESLGRRVRSRPEFRALTR